MHAVQIEKRSLCKFSTDILAATRHFANGIDNEMRRLGFVQIPVGSCCQHLEGVLIFQMPGQDQGKRRASFRAGFFQLLERSQRVELAVENDEVTLSIDFLKQILTGIRFANDCNIARIAQNTFESFAEYGM